jgi:mRNA interferase HicA
MFLLSLIATYQVCTVSLKAGLDTYNALEPTAPMAALWQAGVVHGAAAHRGRSVAETQRLLTVYTYPCTVKPMKRRDLERALRQLGWQFLRHGGKHDVWTDGKREEAIPRPTEMHDKLAQAILRRAKGVPSTYAIARTGL